MEPADRYAWKDGSRGKTMAECLVIEDSEVIRLVARKTLESIGHHVAEASTSAEAMVLCRQVLPDVIFLDWDMPALGALDFLKGIHELRQDERPVIILCATENDAQQFALAKAAGAAFHVLKPYDRKSIETVLSDAGFMSKMDQMVQAATAKAG